MGFFDDISSAIGGVSSFLNSPAVTGTTNLLSAGYDIYSGIQASNRAEQLQNRALDLANRQYAMSQAEADKLAKLYYPIEQTQAQYSLEDLKALRPLQLAQQAYGLERGQQDIAMARQLDPYIDKAQESVVKRLSEGEDVLASRMREQATTDVQAAFDRSRAQNVRQMASYGVNPMSGAFQDYSTKQAQAQALALAGARTQASRLAEDTSLSRQSQAMGLRAGIPLPQVQSTPTSTPGQVASSLASAAGTVAGLAGQANTQAYQHMVGSQYALSNLKDIK